MMTGEASIGRLRVPEDFGEVAGVELDYRVVGNGAPVVFLHGGILTSWFEPVMAEPVLANGYQLISYARSGYAGSSLPETPLTMMGQAACCLALVRHLDLSPVHLVGHSVGACIALQTVLESAAEVASLALLEPPVMSAATDPSATIAALRATAERWQKGDVAGALDAFMRGMVDPDYEEVLGRVLPDGRADALRGTPAFFTTDQHSVQSWKFGAADAARIKQPVLLVLGDRSALVNPIRRQVQDTLLSWMPHAEVLMVPGATHLLPLQKPAEIAAGLAAFYQSQRTAYRRLSQVVDANKPKGHLIVDLERGQPMSVGGGAADVYRN